MAFCRAAPFVVLDVDGVLHPLSEKGLPVNAAFEDLSKRAEEELEDDGLCIFTTIAGVSRNHMNSVYSASAVP